MPDLTIVADTDLGRVRGERTGPAIRFRGLRYGRSTGGKARFLPPSSPEPRAGITDAVRPGASAPQQLLPAYADAFMGWYSETRPQSEDCLFLNVFTPACDRGRRPVMVWLHGGGWMNFASTAPGFDATALAAAEDVVVVSPNHRLGAFGHLAAGGDARFRDAGNAGLLDMVLALDWVQRNAAAFGGDPGNVCLFGQSGGASKVAALMAMPAAQGLFHKAVIQSCSGGIRITEPDEAERLAHVLATALGRDRADGAALQDVPMARMLDALAGVPGVFRPVIDGRRFTRHPFDPDAPEPSRGIPLMIGCTETESAAYLYRDPGNFRLDLDSLRRRLARFLGIDPPEVERIIAAYRSDRPAATASDILVAVTTDQLFKRNTYRIAERHARQAPVWAYVFARPTPVMGGVLGAPHCSEVPFVFGTTGVAAAHVGDGPDVKEMERRMMATWAAFARSGSPANDALPEWRPYSDADRPVMALSRAPQLLSDPGATARAALDPLPIYEYGTSRANFASD
ncbi:carboxylesterase/lipase family protein [Salipiger sp.]|uniref:carboxylesterase/lipase family protein n=1 Tax=Salipiger sp. TaxID=2078585 RepID=UPI003A973098